jgi:hypothetical protein
MEQPLVSFIFPSGVLVMIGVQLAVSELKYFFCFLGYMGEVGCVRVRGKGNTFNLWFERLSMIFSFATFII